MKSLSVWFDLDGVLVDSVGLVERQIEREYGIPFRHYHYTAEPHTLPDDVKRRIRELYRDTRLLSLAPATSDAQHVMTVLGGWCRVGILTSRPSDDEAARHTFNQCLRNFDIEPVLVPNPRLKPAALRTIMADAYVEDCLENANEIAAAGIKTYLLQRLYNQGDTHENVIRCSSLLNVEEAIMAEIQRRHAWR